MSCPSFASALEEADYGISDLGKRHQACSLLACQRHPYFTSFPLFASLSLPHPSKEKREREKKENKENNKYV